MFWDVSVDGINLKLLCNQCILILSVLIICWWVALLVPLAIQWISTAVLQYIGYIEDVSKVNRVLLSSNFHMSIHFDTTGVSRYPIVGCWEVSFSHGGVATHVKPAHLRHNTARDHCERSDPAWSEIGEQNLTALRNLLVSGKRICNYRFTHEMQNASSDH